MLTIGGTGYSINISQMNFFSEVAVDCGVNNGIRVK